MIWYGMVWYGHGHGMGMVWYSTVWFYSSVNPMGSCRARSVYLTTLLLGRLSPLKQLTSNKHILSPETTTALLESADGREWPVKIFHDKSPWKNVANLMGVEPAIPPDHQSDAHPTEPLRLARYGSVQYGVSLSVEYCWMKITCIPKLSGG